MNVLITGAGGFVGRNLVEALKAVRDGKNPAWKELSIDQIYECTRQTSADELLAFAEDADFVFHLAGVNRPKKPSEFMEGNCAPLRELLSALKKAGNTCPVMLSSSAQASLQGRYSGSEYGRSKLEAETILRTYGKESSAKTLIYRFPNVFGKWCLPDYNSAVATFCHHISREIPISVTDPAIELELLYIDDLVDELLRALLGRENRAEEDMFCCVPVTHRATLGEIVTLLKGFQTQRETLTVPVIPEGSFAKKLYAAYLSYLPAQMVSYPLKSNIDPRGSFTELLKTKESGQISVNISRPGITKGQHWHHSKSEIFVVVSGHGLIQMRQIGGEEVLEFPVSGEKPEAVQMLPGYTHNLINLSDTEDLVTLIWANEVFDPARPDTFFEVV